MERIPIKSWAEEDRPREKLLAKGRQALSDAELLAILIGSGSPEETAVELCRRILHSAGNNLNNLGHMSVHDLMKFKGIGEAKALTIAAALELSRRRSNTEFTRHDKITCSKDVASIFLPVLGDLLHEEFWLLFLNRSNGVLGKHKLSSGGMAGTVVDAKMIFKAALDFKASGIILCHNHPSGNLKPSDADVALTRNLKSAGKTLEINVHDHVIIAHHDFFSFADEGLI